MQYVFHAFAGPVPADLDAAEQAARGLDRAPSAEDAQRLKAFATQMVRRFGRALCDEDDDAVWPEEAPTWHAGESAVALAVDMGAAERVIPAAVQAAMAEGLMSFDHELRRLVLPDGRELTRTGWGRYQPPPPSAVRQEADDTPLDDGEISRRLRAGLAPAFERAGLKSLKGEVWFKKAGREVAFEVLGQIVRGWLSLSIEVGPRLEERLSRRCFGPSSLAVDLARALRERGVASPDMRSEISGYAVDIPVLTSGGVRQVVSNLTQVVDKDVAPLVAATATLQGLERLANRVPDEQCPFLWVRSRLEKHMLVRHVDLALAHAVGNPDLGRLALDRLALYEAYEVPTSVMVRSLREAMAVMGIEAPPPSTVKIPT